MRGSKSTIGFGSNDETATVCRESPSREILGNILPDSFAVIVTDVWRAEAPGAIHQYTGRPDRTCRAWANDHNEAPASALIAIQKGKEGFRILKRMMRDDPPDWWVNLMELAECGEAYEKCRMEIRGKP